MEITSSNRVWPIYTVTAGFSGRQNDATLAVREALLSPEQRHFALKYVGADNGTIVVQAHSDLSQGQATVALSDLVKNAIPGGAESVLSDVSSYFSLLPTTAENVGGKIVDKVAAGASKVVEGAASVASTGVSGLVFALLPVLVIVGVGGYFLVKNGDKVGKLVAGVRK